MTSDTSCATRNKNYKQVQSMEKIQQENWIFKLPLIFHNKTLQANKWQIKNNVYKSSGVLTSKNSMFVK